MYLFRTVHANKAFANTDKEINESAILNISQEESSVSIAAQEAATPRKTS